eukprot:1159274-Pelagomonas_calceolata.AAC.1
MPLQMSSKKSKGISVKAATKRATKKDKVAKKTDSDAEGMTSAGSKVGEVVRSCHKESSNGHGHATVACSTN